MGLIISKFKARSVFSAALAVAMLMSAMSLAFSFSSQADEISNTSICGISNFTQSEITDNFDQWSNSSGFVDYTGSTSSVSDGVLTVTGGEAGNTRYSAHFHKTEALNQTVGVSFGMDGSNPAASAVIWLRAGSYYRTEIGDWVPTGYYINCSRYGGYSTVTLHKAHENSSGVYALTQIGQVAYNLYSYSDLQKAFLDITIEATAFYDEQAKITVITIYVYKGTTMLYSAAFEDDEAELQDMGKVGFAVNNNKNLTVPFKSFAYHSTDSVDGCRFITENTAKKDGTIVGLYTAIDPTATYEFSAYVDASASPTGTFEGEPLCIMYKGESGKGQPLYFTPTDADVKIDSKYKKYTYTVALPNDYVAESGTFKGSVSSKTEMTLAYVGYAMKDDAINGIKYASFELRQVNANGSLGGNLLCNGDFKMGMYGWSDNITPALWQITPQDFDQTVLGQYERAFYSRVENQYDYWRNFVSSGFTAGELNLDKKINICDLVCIGELSDYDIFADIDKNGIVDNTDENAIKNALLNWQDWLKSGEQKIAQVDTLASNKKAEILKTVSTLENTANAKIYYVSSSGNDNNTGSKSSPWKTIDKVNAAVSSKTVEDKYVICFNRGDTFRGKLVADSNVSYTAYGTGEKPVITVSPENAADTQKWILVDAENNIYRYITPLSDVGSIFFDGGKSYASKRTPDIIKDTSGNYSYVFGYEALEDMQFVCLPDAASAVALNNNNAASITGDLYLRCDSGNPGTVYNSIEFNIREYVIHLNSRANNIVIDNLAVKFGGAHGIGGGNISNLLVQNCEVAYIGGGIQHYSEKDNGDGTFTYEPLRYGNGVEVNTACDGYTVDNCYIHDIYDTGVTHQTGSNHTAPLVFKDVSYVNNLIENCTYSVEYFAITGTTEAATMIMDNILVADNIMRNAGRGFGVTRTLQESMWNMSAHIMGWASHENRLADNSSFVIRNNIFDRSIYSEPSRAKRINSSLILVAASNAEWLPNFSGNTYIHYLDSAFGYCGVSVPSKVFNATYFSKHALTVNVNFLLGDSNGEVFFTTLAK